MDQRRPWGQGLAVAASSVLCPAPLNISINVLDEEWELVIIKHVGAVLVEVGRMTESEFTVVWSQRNIRT